MIMQLEELKGNVVRLSIHQLMNSGWVLVADQNLQRLLYRYGIMQGIRENILDEEAKRVLSYLEQGDLFANA